VVGMPSTRDVYVEFHAFFIGVNSADSLRYSSLYIQGNRKIFTESRKPASTPYLNFEFSWVNKLELLGQLLKTNN
jgi:hypothetical protein